jgi:hypothetical protein
MQWKRTFELLLPAMFTKHVPESMNFAPMSDVVLSKHVWHVSMDKQLGYQVTFADKISLDEDSDSQTFRLSLEKTKECFSDNSDLSVAMTGNSFDAEQTNVSSYNVASVSAPKKRGRPRKNSNLSPSKVIQKRGRARKVPTPVVQPENRRFTCSYLNEKGFNSRINYAERSVQRKFPRAKMSLVQSDNGSQENFASTGNAEEESEDIQYPATPIRVMQNVGV